MAKTAKTARELEAATTLFLDHAEELRMGLSDEQLIDEAVECNHAGVGDRTLGGYRGHLAHFAQYLASVHGSDLYRANKKQVRLFMRNLEKKLHFLVPRTLRHAIHEFAWHSDQGTHDRIGSG